MKSVPGVSASLLEFARKFFFKRRHLVLRLFQSLVQNVAVRFKFRKSLVKIFETSRIRRQNRLESQINLLIAQSQVVNLRNIVQKVGIGRVNRINNVSVGIERAAKTRNFFVCLQKSFEPSREVKIFVRSLDESAGRFQKVFEIFHSRSEICECGFVFG